MKEINTNRWAYSPYGERYYGDFATKEEAIEEYKNEYPDYEDGYVGECIKYEFTESDCDTFADNILEIMDETLGDICGEYSEDWLQSISREQEEELNQILSVEIIKWINKHNLHPTNYMIENSETFKVVINNENI